MFSCFSVPVKKHEEFCINVVKCGVTPKHIAFILDGNRRYGKKLNMDMMSIYKAGANKCLQVLDWCVLFDIEEVTVFALSIHNLERSATEVTNLMAVLLLLIESAERDQEIFKKRGIQVRLTGNSSLYPDSMKEVIAAFNEKFKHNTKMLLNVAMFYTSQDEITTAILNIANSNQVQVEDINEKLISKHLFISRDVDLLIRTSGETRLSNFLLWQTSKAYISFEKCLWPEFSFWSFIKIILRYQLHKNKNL